MDFCGACGGASWARSPKNRPPADRDHADPAAIELVAAAGPDALKPLAPVHVRARRDASGVALSWIRRARRDGDAWEPVETPLGEATEAYEVDILQAATLVRTLTSATPALLYPAAQELADFSAPQSALTLRVAQLSAMIGRGFEAKVIVPVI